MKGGYPVSGYPVRVVEYWQFKLECGHKHKTEAAAKKCRDEIVKRYRKQRWGSPKRSTPHEIC